VAGADRERRRPTMARQRQWHTLRGADSTVYTARDSRQLGPTGASNCEGAGLLRGAGAGASTGETAPLVCIHRTREPEAEAVGVSKPVQRRAHIECHAPKGMPLFCTVPRTSPQLLPPALWPGERRLRPCSTWRAAANPRRAALHHTALHTAHRTPHTAPCRTPHTAPCRTPRAPNAHVARTGHTFRRSPRGTSKNDRHGLYR